jgi:hypothetical protein
MGLSALLAACGAFLLAVIWMDLMFDVQVLRQPRARELPEEVLASISAYYARATTRARPMGHLIGAVMVVTSIGAVVQMARGTDPAWAEPLVLALCGAPILLALARTVRHAVRLGTRRDDLARQSTLARSICRDHLFCFAAMLAFVALQLWLAAV